MNATQNFRRAASVLLATVILGPTLLHAQTIPEPPGSLSASSRQQLSDLYKKFGGMPHSPMPAPDDRQGWRQLRQNTEAAIKPIIEPVLRKYPVSVEREEYGGVPVLVITPPVLKDRKLAIVYVHGGGYVQGSAASTILSAAIVAHEAGAKVVSIDYTVAPDFKWQQITDQVISVLEAMKEKHISMKNVAMFGDSAGGGLIAGAVLKARDQGKSVPAALVLWSPWADITDTGDTYRTLRQTDFLNYESLRQGALAYADEADQKLPYVSPVYGNYEKPFPPTLIQGGLREIFLSDFVRLYQALDSSGREVKLDLYEAMPHVFQAILSDTDESRNAVRKTVRFMKNHISKTAK